MTIPAQDTEPLTPEVIDAIQQLVAETMNNASTQTSVDWTGLLPYIFGGQLVALVTMLGVFLAAIKWLDGRRAEDRAAADRQRALDKAEAADQRAEDREAADRQRAEDREAAERQRTEDLEVIRTAFTREREEREVLGERLEKKMDDGFREVMIWIRWLVFTQMGQPVPSAFTPPDAEGLPRVPGTAAEPSATQSS